MEDKNLQSVPIEDLVNQVQALAAVASEPQVRSVAALAARCTIELVGSVGQLWAGLFDVKKSLAERLRRTLPRAKVGHNGSVPLYPIGSRFAEAKRRIVDHSTK